MMVYLFYRLDFAHQDNDSFLTQEIEDYKNMHVFIFIFVYLTLFSFCLPLFHLGLCIVFMFLCSNS